MAAKKSGGSAGRIKAKNNAMAARMKADGETRHTCLCPICHRKVALASLYLHLGKCNAG